MTAYLGIWRPRTRAGSDRVALCPRVRIPRVPIRGELDGAQPVVLVDNGNSTEIRAALDALARETDRLAIVRGHGNMGFLKRCNRGADRAAQSHDPWNCLVELFRNAL